MPAPKISYIGSSTAGIWRIPWEGYEDSPLYPSKADFAKSLSEGVIKNYKYLFAVSANKYQKGAREILSEQGFREVVEFYSNHIGSIPHVKYNEFQETLSLWVKTQEDYNKDFNINSLKEPFNPGNCSVAITRDYPYKCMITLLNQGDSVKDDAFLKSNGFKRVKNMPIYFKIDPKFVITEELKQGAAVKKEELAVTF